MFDGTKSKFESWIASVENAGQISKQDILHIVFSKMIGSPPTSGHRLRDHLLHLMWKDLRSNILRPYSTIPFNSHATQTFSNLQQGPYELLEMYLHLASELLSKVHHMTDMTEVPVEGLKHYTIGYGLNFTKLKDRVEGHQSTYWKTMEECFSDSCTFGAGYDRARVYYDTPGASVVNEVKSSKVL